MARPEVAHKHRLMTLIAVVLLLAMAAPFAAVTPAFAAGIIRVDISDAAAVYGSGQPNPYSVVYRSLQDAIDDAGAGDTVSVAAGTYCENVVLNKPVQLLGAGADVTVIDGGGRGDAVRNFYDLADGGIGVDGFVISGFTIKSFDTYAVRLVSNERTSGVITKNIIRDSAFGIGIHGNCSVDVADNLIFSNRHSTNIDGFGVAVMTNTSSGCRSKICNNTIVDNYHGIWIYDSNADITNNIVVNNRGGQNVESTGIDHHYGGTVNISYNDVYGNDVNYRADASPGVGDISADPVFYDPDNHDLSLCKGSPCIDAGYNNAVPGWLTSDFQGNPRIMDGDGNLTKTVDIGAYEGDPESGAVAPVPETSTVILFTLGLFMLGSCLWLVKRRRDAALAAR